MVQVSDICNWLELQAPLVLSEDWDNTGLLLGDPEAEVQRLMTCLTMTPETVAEAVDGGCNMVVVHHPLPFKPVARITRQSYTGRLLWDLASNGVSLYAPHTAWDSAGMGINQRLANRLQLAQCDSILPVELSESEAAGEFAEATSSGIASPGAGRIGTLDSPCSLNELAQRLAESVPGARCRGVESGRELSRVALACGSGGSFLGPAIAKGCDVLVTGEATYHTCLEARAAEVALLMIGHHASERFSLDELATLMSEQFDALDVWASRNESDPVVSIKL